MRFRTFLVAVLVAGLGLSALPSSSSAQGLKRTLTGFDSGKSRSKSKPQPKKGDPKPFSEMIKDRVKIEGLFTFYQDTTDNSLLMAITPEQFDEIFLCGETVSRSAGVFSDAGRMYRTYPFYFTRVGKNVQLMEKNLRLRANAESPLHRAVEAGISDHLLGATPVASLPEDSTNAILVDAETFFIQDATNISYFAGRIAKTGFKFDSKNSYIQHVLSFPENSEIDVRLHYASAQPLNSTTMQNPYSVYQTHHYSLSTLPKTDFKPRVADERMGHFLTVYEDYSSPAYETAYVRYAQRWNLKKADPSAALSEPVEPIVYWVENTVPEEYRPMVAEGIEFWNASFEKIGFKNAIVAKQMPDTADWDPADVRYSTVRWIVPGSGPAVGPSRANPFTGQIYDADVRIPADFIRHMFNTADRYIEPLSFNGMMPESSADPMNADGEMTADVDEFETWMHSSGNDFAPCCSYARESFNDAAMGFAYISSLPDDFAGKDSLTKEYVHEYIVQLVAHEVGHTLGFRHNFKASAIYSLEQINDRAFTEKNGNLGTVMDYPSVNVAGPNATQGQFYSTTPGRWDDWVIEYAYSDFGDLSPEEERRRLEQIASKSGDPELAYGTDEDGFGYSIKSSDPMCNLFDLGDDPIAYAKHATGLSKELWSNAIERMEKPGVRYQHLYNVFLRGWSNYSQASRLATKYIGGLYRYRGRIGDPNGKTPFVPVPASEQRRAMAFLRDHIFAADAFDFPSHLMNKLQYEQYPDFSWSVYSVQQVDFPIHQRVLYVQQVALSRLYSPYVIGRLLNNVERVDDPNDRYTMIDMFTDVRRAIWGEVVGPTNVNSYRRQLQMAHLNWIMNIYLSGPSRYPTDARTLAANDLDILENAATKASRSSGLDAMSQAHFKEVVRQIQTAKEARRDYSMR